MLIDSGRVRAWISLRHDRITLLGHREFECRPTEGLDAAFAIAMGKRRQLLPQFFGDERHDWVS